MTRLVSAGAVTLVVVSGLVQLRAQSALPSGWPVRLELGMADAPGCAAAMKATAPFAFRYQYLAGGVNIASGWATWTTNGDFPRFYIQDSIANGIIPVFTYYQLLQSTPGGPSESDADYNNLNNVATMTASPPSTPWAHARLRSTARSRPTSTSPSASSAIAIQVSTSMCMATAEFTGWTLKTSAASRASSAASPRRRESAS